MRYRKLGKTGLSVSEIGLGAEWLERHRAEAVQALIDRCTFGVVAISTGEDTPYCLPLSLVRVDNRLYFHCAKQGRKLDLLRRDPRVCVTFVAADQPAYLPESNMYTTFFQSAVVTGTAFEVTDPGQKTAALRALCEKMTPGHMEGFEEAVRRSLTSTAVWGLHMEEVTGKEKARKR